MCSDNYANQTAANQTPVEARTAEQIMVDMMKADLGIDISPQAWRLFLRWRWERFAPLAHRIHDGKR